MTISINRNRGLNNTEQEVIVFKVEGDLFEKMHYAFTLCQNAGRTFLAVIDTPYAPLSMHAFDLFFDKFTFINDLPAQQPEYRICLVIDRTQTIERDIAKSFDQTPETLFDWAVAIAKGAYLATSAWDAVTKEPHPLLRNQWVTIENQVEDGVTWCRKNAVWSGQDFS
ncbi:MAG: hypothetical protein KDE56_06730 [Anaerolineales bacterium]|nr:hypothetical protein [Anaerolineales bacterium]